MAMLRSATGDAAVELPLQERPMKLSEKIPLKEYFEGFNHETLINTGMILAMTAVLVLLLSLM